MELRVHVSGCTDCQQRIQRLKEEVQSVPLIARASMSAGSGEAAGIEPDALTRLPARFGPYRVVGMIADEAHLATCRALAAHLGKEVRLTVCKVPRTPDAEQSQWAGELRERLQSLADPAIAAVYDFSWHEDRLLLAQQFVRGTPWDRALGESGRHGSTTLAQLRQVVHAVSAAHARGVAHGSIQPGSILVHPSGQAVLTDFGLRALRRWAEAVPVIDELREPAFADDLAAIGDLLRQIARWLPAAKATRLNAAATRAAAPEGGYASIDAMATDLAEWLD